MISRNVDPSQDIHFSKGPVDILDHSSSSYAFGSKMGVDATRKLPETAQCAMFRARHVIDREEYSQVISYRSHISMIPW